MFANVASPTADPTLLISRDVTTDVLYPETTPLETSKETSESEAHHQVSAIEGGVFSPSIADERERSLLRDLTIGSTRKPKTRKPHFIYGDNGRYGDCRPKRQCRRKDCQACQQYLRLSVIVPALIPFLVGRDVYHVVLTVPHNFNPLRDTLATLSKAFNKLVDRAAWNGVRGYLRAFHVEYGDSGWHPHYHLIIEAERSTANRIRAAWKDLTGATQVDVKRLKQADVDREKLSTYVPNHVQDSFRDDAALMKQYRIGTYKVRRYVVGGTFAVIPTSRQSKKRKPPVQLATAA